MKRNTIFAVMMMGMMSMVSVSTMAQGRAMGGGHQTSSRGFGMNMGNRQMGNAQMNSRGSNRCGASGGYIEGGYIEGRGGGAGYIEVGRGGCGGGRGYYREMCGHRWDSDGWCEGWRGRVRCCGDGRWGYYRNGGWIYYDCFYEPDYYFANPVSMFAPHVYVSGPAVCVGGPVGYVSGAAAVGGLIGTAIGAIIGAATY